MAKSHLVQEFTERLQIQCKDITVNFGHEEIGIEFLGHSTEYLIKVRCCYWHSSLYCYHCILSL